MATKVLEFQRVQMSNQDVAVINFVKKHSEKPVVTATLETTETSSNVQNSNIYIKEISKLRVVFGFTFPVTGYLHIHASSIKRQ